MKKMLLSTLVLAGEARSALNLAEQAIDQLIEAIEQGSIGTMPIPWFDWVECQILYRKAHLFITGAALPEDPRLRTIEQRALAAIQNGSAATD